jgi:surface antigen
MTHQRAYRRCQRTLHNSPDRAIAGILRSSIMLRRRHPLIPMSLDQVVRFARTRIKDMTRRLLSFVACANAIPLTLLLLWPVDASAQYGRTFRTTIKLTRSDIVIIRKIVREDLTGRPNGTTLAWSNPESQNSGTVTLLSRFNSQRRDCRRVRYFINPGPQQPPSVISATYVLTTCRLPDGTWQLDNQAQPDNPR